MEALKDKDGERKRLGTYFIAIMEFLEKSSSTFTGFFNDINQMIIEKDIYLYLFDIVDYFKYSDVLVSKTFKIIQNMINSKFEDV